MSERCGFTEADADCEWTEDEHFPCPAPDPDTCESRNTLNCHEYQPTPPGVRVTAP